MGKKDMKESNHAQTIDLSIIVVARDDDEASSADQLYAEYRQQIERTGLSYEFVFVVAGDYVGVYADLCRMKEEGACIKLIKFATWHSDAAAFSAGVDHSSGSLLLTLPFFHQIDPQAIPSFVSELANHDMVVGRRWPRKGSWTNKLQTRIFHYLLRKSINVDFHDLGCNIRILKRRVAETVQIYGDQYRFFPVLVSRSGFKVKEIKVPQKNGVVRHRRYAKGLYIRRLLDLFSIFFLVKFTRKPLRFFGLTGLFIFLIGAGYTAFLAIQRMFMGVALADRPVLLFGLLMIVLGIQMYAIGLIGELIIFVHARDVKDYVIEKIIN